MKTYKCAECEKVFEKTRSDEEAEKEAFEEWGVSDSSTNDDMAIVCDDCFTGIVARRGKMKIRRTTIGREI